MRLWVMLLAAAACTDTPAAAVVEEPALAQAPADKPRLAVARARLTPLGQSGVSGLMILREQDGAVVIEGEVSGLTPKAQHGFHIHEEGDCSSPDGSSAGPHFNPQGAPHGAPHDSVAHLGDLGNIEADTQGVARVTVSRPGVTLSPGANGIVGRSIIVHQTADDLKSQPTGNAGGRIACGVINLTM
jgi:superoxide dismutase, Cu-Zn family